MFCLNNVAFMHLVCSQKGEMIDAKDPTMGAWFEAKIVDISFADENDPSSILYHVVFDG